MTKTYELTFWGGIPQRDYRFLKPVKRLHATFESAKKEAERVLTDLSERGAHPAIIYGPDLGKDGYTVQ